MDSPVTRFRSATLSIALAASLAVHVSMFAALVGVDAGPHASPDSDTPLAAPLLEARLVAATPSLPAVAAVTVPAPAAFAPSAAPPETAPPSPSLVKPSPGASAGERSVVGWKPRIVVNDRVPRARFGDALDGDALAAFLTEVDAGVGLPQRFNVAYPRAALAARKEGSVLVWAVIDAQGRVDSVHVVEGDPEFAEAVEEALKAAPFVPARNLGEPVPFYVTLEFEFRLDATGGSLATARPGNAGAR
jgi:periplasmic protein TonB